VLEQLPRRGRQIGDHIVRNDPHTVLRRCAADRRILEAHEKVHRCPIPVLNSTVGGLWGTEEDGPCWTLILLADGYGITVDGAP
jgi:hypothetical protein